MLIYISQYVFHSNIFFNNKNYELCIKSLAKSIINFFVFHFSVVLNMGTPENSLANNQESETTTVLMRSEAQRLSTFGGWQHNDKVEARKIAKAGFFHTGNDSEVKCPWCFVVLNHWEYGDQVMARHRTANPDCPFIQNISDNVPLINDAQSQVNTSQSESEDNDGKFRQATL